MSDLSSLVAELQNQAVVCNDSNRIGIITKGRIAKAMDQAAAEITRLRAELAIKTSEARDKALDEAANELERLDGHGEWYEAAQAIRALKSPKPQEATMNEGVGG